jgi:hypothetical protein
MTTIGRGAAAARAAAAAASGRGSSRAEKPHFAASRSCAPANAGGATQALPPETTVRLAIFLSADGASHTCAG